nr:DsbA family protein [Eikenella corrodens]
MRHEDGSDIAKSDVLADVLRQFGCMQAAEILTSPATEEEAKQRIAEGANLAQQFGVSGVPFVVRQTESGQAQIASDSWR